MAIQITSNQKDMIKGYQKEVFGVLDRINEEQTVFKDIVKAASETTNIPKKVVSKYFKAQWKGKVKEIEDEAEAIGFLSE